jgi:hypothetical protein
VDFGSFFLSFLIYTQSAELLWRLISPSQGRYLHTEQHKDRYPCFWVGFEHMIPVFERAKTVHELDRSATVIGARQLYSSHYIFLAETRGSLWILCLKLSNVIGMLDTYKPHFGSVRNRTPCLDHTLYLYNENSDDLFLLICQKQQQEGIINM